jgi:hypothetical protein
MKAKIPCPIYTTAKTKPMFSASSANFGSALTAILVRRRTTRGAYNWQAVIPTIPKTVKIKNPQYFRAVRTSLNKSFINVLLL